ncbi:MAG: ribosome recycling factor [Bacillota bacterium]|nr:MAG: ribosome recycling factor [Bacillota bacterium]
MLKEILEDAERRMEAAIENCRRELAALRAGRASPALLEKIRVDYYGTQVPVNQVATVTVPEPRLIVIQPWDRNVLAEIERAIVKSDLGLTPANDGKVIRLTVPPLTEERRQELVKQARRLAEEGRVAIRNIRRDANDTIRELEKEGEASEDEARRALDDVQKLTDRCIARIDEMVEAREREILEV